MNIYSIDKQDNDLKYDQTKSEIPIDRHSTDDCEDEKVFTG